MPQYNEYWFADELFGRYARNTPQRDDFRSYRPDLDADDCARRVRLDALAIIYWNVESDAAQFVFK